MEPNTTPASETTTKLSNSDIFKVAIWAFKIYFQVDKNAGILLLILGLIQTLDQLIYTYLFASLVDSLVATVTSGSTDYTPIAISIGTISVFSILFRIIRVTHNYYENKYSYKFDAAVEVIMDKKLMALGIQNLENPDIANKVFRAGIAMGSLRSFVEDVTSTLEYVFQFISRAVVVISISAPLVILFIVSALPLAFVDRKYRGKLWKLRIDQTENRRKASNSTAFLNNPSYLEEVLILGAGEFLLAKYVNFYDWFTKVRTDVLRSWFTTNYFIRLGKLIISLFGIGLVIRNFLLKQISVGTVTFQISTLQSFENSADGILSNLNSISEKALTIKDVMDLFEAEPVVPDGDITLQKLTTGPEIKLENVTFTYPGSNRTIFENLNLHIKPGEKVAIVGQNGAGKTSLVKIILRYYKIDSGKISVNGFNINDLVLNTYYRNVGLLSQEYNQYGPLTVKENVTIGQVNKDYNEEEFIEALRSAEALGFVENLKHKFDQLLNERFKEGTKLSSGQWQKIALARFFYRNSPLVIFDEPTSSIDAVSEYNIFNKIYSFFTNKTVIIISHRFSTVRSADRILVIDEGSIVEEGSHEELMKLNGKYAKSFLLQAEGYTNSIV